jgi:hypothetical protein
MITAASKPGLRTLRVLALAWGLGLIGTLLLFLAGSLGASRLAQALLSVGLFVTSAAGLGAHDLDLYLIVIFVDSLIFGGVILGLFQFARKLRRRPSED